MTRSASATSERASPASQPEAWWRIRSYPLVFPACAVALVWGSAQLHPVALVRPITVVLIVSYLVSILVVRSVGDRDAGSLVVVALLLALSMPPTTLTVALMLVGVLLWIFLLHFRTRRFHSSHLVVRIGSAGAAIVAITTLLTLLGDGAIVNGARDLLADAAWAPAVNRAPPDSPDLLILLLDAFPGDQAALIAGADPMPFKDALRARGFAVQEQSRSNYLYTGLTLASMLDMRHLYQVPALAAPWDDGAGDGRRLREVINSGSALRAFVDRGYHVTYVSPGFDHADLRRVDRLVSSPGPSELELSMLQVSAIGRFIDMAVPDLFASLQRDRILGSFRVAETIAAEPHERPRLILVHIPAPHAPWVFHRDGTPRPAGLRNFFSDDPTALGITKQAAFAAASDQADFIARTTLRTVDHILEAGVDAPVIVVMSDHGSGVGLADDARDSDLAERSSNVMAIRDTQHPGILDRPLTPVNLFVRILDAHFGAGLEEVPNDTYAWRGSLLDVVRIDPTTFAGP